jgi:hypothetical protein
LHGELIVTMWGLTILLIVQPNALDWWRLDNNVFSADDWVVGCSGEAKGLKVGREYTPSRWKSGAEPRKNFQITDARR